MPHHDVLSVFFSFHFVEFFLLFPVISSPHLAGELRRYVPALPYEPLQRRLRAAGGFDRLRDLRDGRVLPRDLLGVPAHHRIAVDAPCL